MPVIAATDPNTDIGKIVEENGFGFSVINADLVQMQLAIDSFIKEKLKLKTMGEIGFEFLKRNYLVDFSYQKIMQKIT